MIKQTTLKRIRISTNRVTQRTSFVFPFFDRYLYISFFLVVTDAGPYVFQDKLSWAKRGLLVNQGYNGRRPLDLRDVDPDKFHRLFHFDPWWTMRHAEDVEPGILDAIIATNLAARRLGHLMIRDIVFDINLEKVEEVLVGDGVFRPVSFTQTRLMPQDLENAFFR